MEGRMVRYHTFLDAKAATGVGNTLFVKDFRNIIVKVGTASSANLTCKCQGSIGEIAPDFSATQTVANNWDYVQMIDLQDGSAINGDTGFVASGTDDFRLFEVNTNGLDFINFRVTARAAGSITIVGQLTTNI